jgi:hypothetical protein
MVEIHKPFNCKILHPRHVFIHQEKKTTWNLAGLEILADAGVATLNPAVGTVGVVGIQLARQIIAGAKMLRYFLFHVKVVPFE